MREMCESLDLNYDKLRKKWNFLLIVGLVGVIGLYIFLQEIFVVIFFFIMYFYVQSDKQSIITQARKLKLLKQQEFVNFVSYITIF